MIGTNDDDDRFESSRPPCVPEDVEPPSEDIWTWPDPFQTQPIVLPFIIFIRLLLVANRMKEEKKINVVKFLANSIVLSNEFAKDLTHHLLSPFPSNTY